MTGENGQHTPEAFEKNAVYQVMIKKKQNNTHTHTYTHTYTYTYTRRGVWEGQYGRVAPPPAKSKANIVEKKKLGGVAWVRAETEKLAEMDDLEPWALGFME